VWAFWKSVTEHSDELIARVRSTKVTMDEWYAQREIQANKRDASIIDLGFSTFFLNRTNRSGILTAGVIGGKDQTGPWKINARFNKQNLIDRLGRVATYKSRIHVTRLDALAFIARRSASLPPRRSLVYLDPPYFVKGQKLYLNAYGLKDHAEVAAAVTEQLNIPWMVSYDDVPEIRGLYASANRMSYVLRYSASSTRKGQELVFTSPGLRVRRKLLLGA
jgi:DNA adenine methylase